MYTHHILWFRKIEKQIFIQKKTGKKLSIFIHKNFETAKVSTENHLRLGSWALERKVHYISLNSYEKRVYQSIHLLNKLYINTECLNERIN